MAGTELGKVCGGVGGAGISQSVLPLETDHFPLSPQKRSDTQSLGIFLGPPEHLEVRPPHGHS